MKHGRPVLVTRKMFFLEAPQVRDPCQLSLHVLHIFCVVFRGSCQFPLYVFNIFSAWCLEVHIISLCIHITVTSIPFLHFTHHTTYNAFWCFITGVGWYPTVCQCVLAYIFFDILSLLASFPFKMPVFCAQSFKCFHCTIIHLIPENKVIFNHNLKHICWFQYFELMKFYSIICLLML